MDKQVKLGEAVVYVNPVGVPRPALVTAVWGPTCINVVTVSDNEKEGDSYGRQIERFTSLSHKGQTPVHGNYWMFQGEELNPIVKPQQA